MRNLLALLINWIPFSIKDFIYKAIKHPSQLKWYFMTDRMRINHIMKMDFKDTKSND